MPDTPTRSPGPTDRPRDDATPEPVATNVGRHDKGRRGRGVRSRPKSTRIIEASTSGARGRPSQYGGARGRAPTGAGGVPRLVQRERLLGRSLWRAVRLLRAVVKIATAHRSQRDHRTSLCDLPCASDRQGRDERRPAVRAMLRRTWRHDVGHVQWQQRRRPADGVPGRDGGALRE